MSQTAPSEVPNFLVPLDGSRLAESVLPAVEELARRYQAQVTLLHIIEENPPSTVHGDRHLTTVAEAQVYLQGIAHRLHLAAPMVETHVHEDKEENVAQSIVEHAQELKANLVIMCAHGSGGLRGFLFGSIAQQALQRGTQSILLIQPRKDGSAPPFQLQRILVPLDGSEAHEPALPAAIRLARLFEASLRLVVVVPTRSTLSGEQAVSGILLPTTMRAMLDLAQENASSYLERALAQCQSEGVPASSEVLRGEPVSVLLSAAERLDTDLLVMASHGRTGLDALFSGSVTARVAGQFTRPILLVRATSDQR